MIGDPPSDLVDEQHALCVDVEKDDLGPVKFRGLTKLQEDGFKEVASGSE